MIWFAFVLAVISLAATTWWDILRTDQGIRYTMCQERTWIVRLFCSERPSLGSLLALFISMELALALAILGLIVTEQHILAWAFIGVMFGACVGHVRGAREWEMILRKCRRL